VEHAFRVASVNNKEQGLRDEFLTANNKSDVISCSSWTNDNTLWYFNARGQGWKLENKFYRDKQYGIPKNFPQTPSIASSLDADSCHGEGRVYRSEFDNDNTNWFLFELVQYK
jgi:hypothetical protein